MRTWKWYSKLLLALAIAACAVFVWPTRWQYLPPIHFVRVTYPARCDRLTGRAQYLTLDGWQPAQPRPPQPPVAQNQLSTPARSSALDELDALAAHRGH